MTIEPFNFNHNNNQKMNESLSIIDNITNDIGYSAEDRVVFVLINLSVISLGSFGIFLNAFSLYVLWKCMTTGQLGIKLVLLSDLFVCIGYVAFNIISNIINSLSNQLNSQTIVTLATLSRMTTLVTLFVSNWWIIALLFLRILSIFSSVNVKSWDKMLYHKLVYGFCWITGVVIVIPLRFYELYFRIVIYIVPVVLVSVEAGLIIYGIKQVQVPHIPSTIKNKRVSYQDVPCSSSTSSNYYKNHNTNPQTVKASKHYNNLVFTILLLALNFLVLDSLQFIDTLHAISRFTDAPLPMWFMLLINIFSLSKRILNFVILCAKCRHFRKIMNLKLNLISTYFQRRKVKNRKHSFAVHDDPYKNFNYCHDCQRPVLFSMDNDFLSHTNLIERIAENAPFPTKKTQLFKIRNDTFIGNSYFSAFEMSPNVPENTNHLVLSERY